jgi:hypothetical protein
LLRFSKSGRPIFRSSIDVFMPSSLNIEFSLFDIFLDLPSLVIVDVGALPLDGTNEVYAPIIERDKAVLFAFEAND